MARKTNELYNLLANEQNIMQRIRCHDIVRVEDFDAVRMTVTVKPLVQREMAGTYVSPPPILAVKVAYIPLEIKVDGKTADVNVQIKKGDIGVVAYLDMDSDNSIQTGADSKPNTDRIHSGDDAVFVGVIRKG